MKRSKVSRAFAAFFTATSLAVIALQGGVAQADDGVVNAADFVVWRDNLGAPGVVEESDYEVWKANFGAAAAGQGSDLDPEWKYVQVRR